MLVFMPDGHVDRLEGKIRELQEIFADFGSAKRDLGAMWKIIHQPGWTTPAELALVEAVLNAEKKYAQATLGLNKALLSGAEKSSPEPTAPPTKGVAKDVATIPLSPRPLGHEELRMSCQS